MQSNPPTPPGSAKPSKPTPTAAAFPAAVLKVGGQVHRLPDGEGGYFQVAIINPAALRNGNQGGRN